MATLTTTCQCDREYPTGTFGFSSSTFELSQNDKSRAAFAANFYAATNTVKKDFFLETERNGGLPKLDKKQRSVVDYFEEEYKILLDYQKPRPERFIRNPLNAKNWLVLSYARFEKDENSYIIHSTRKKWGFSIGVGFQADKQITMYSMLTGESTGLLEYSSNSIYNIDFRLPVRNNYYIGIGSSFATLVDMNVYINDNFQARITGNEFIWGGQIGMGTINQVINPNFHLHYSQLNLMNSHYRTIGLGMGIDLFKGDIKLGIAYRMDVVLSDLEYDYHKIDNSGADEIFNNTIPLTEIRIVKYFSK